MDEEKGASDGEKAAADDGGIVNAGNRVLMVAIATILGRNFYL